MNTSAPRVLDDDVAVLPTGDFRLGLALIVVVAFVAYGGLYLLFR